MKHRILLAVDASQTSAKAVEYVARMLEGCAKCEITLFHVCEMPPQLLEKGHLGMDLKPDCAKWREECRQRVEKEIFAPAREVFRERGLLGNGVSVTAKLEPEAHPDVAKAILLEAKEGKYGTVVMGRWGMSMVRDFMFGSVTSRVVHHLQECAVWIVE